MIKSLFEKKGYQGILEFLVMFNCFLEINIFESFS